MRKLTLVLIILAMGAMLAHAEVLSKNAVGYVKVEVEPGELAIIAQPFLPIDPLEDPTPSLVFGGSLPVDSRLFIWDGLEYQLETFQEQIGPPPGFIVTTNWFPNTALLEPGKAFWIRIPAGAPEAQDVFVMGEVPDFDETDVYLIEGLAMVAFPYPAEMRVEDTVMGQNAQLDDRIFIWDIETQEYSLVTYQEQIGPPPGFIVTTNWFPADVVIPAGAGFWYRAGSASIPTELKPYTWP